MVYGQWVSWLTVLIPCKYLILFKPVLLNKVRALYITEVLIAQGKRYLEYVGVALMVYSIISYNFMEEKIENVSVLNVVCFILYGLSNILENPRLFHIGFLGVLFSFCVSVWLLMKSRLFKNKEEKRIFIRSINSLIFCVFFSLCYILTFM